MVARKKVRHWRIRIAVVFAIVAGSAPLASCDRSASGGAASSGLTAATLGTQNVLEAERYKALPEYANASLELGERISLQCRACHTFEKGGPNMVGPNLHKFFNQRAAALENFPYSRALSDSDFVWTPRAVDAWLAAPRDFLPGNSMVYAGLTDPADRAALIAYLLVSTE